MWVGVHPARRPLIRALNAPTTGTRPRRRTSFAPFLSGAPLCPSLSLVRMCNGGPSPCIGVTLIILGIFSIEYVWWSIPCIILGSMLTGCCCTGGSPKSLATYMVVVGWIHVLLFVVGGIVLYAGATGWCDSLWQDYTDAVNEGLRAANLGYEVTYSDLKESDVLHGHCTMCEQFGELANWGASMVGEDEPCPPDVGAGCYFCVYDGFVIWATFAVVYGLVFFLPATILSMVVCCKKDLAAPPAAGGVTMASASGSV